MNHRYLEVGTVIRNKKSSDYWVILEKGEIGILVKKLDSTVSKGNLNRINYDKFEITDLDEATAKLIMSL